MTQAGIEHATFRLVAQHLNHCASINMNFRIYLRSSRFPGTHWTGGTVSLTFGKEVAKTVVSNVPRMNPEHTVFIQLISWLLPY